MPTYGAAKRKDMIRSVLPSTRRHGARKDKALYKRTSRHLVRQALRDYEDDRFDFRSGTHRLQRGLAVVIADVTPIRIRGQHRDRRPLASHDGDDDPSTRHGHRPMRRDDDNGGCRQQDVFRGNQSYLTS